MRVSAKGTVLITKYNLLIIVLAGRMTVCSFILNYNLKIKGKRMQDKTQRDTPVIEYTPINKR